LTQVDLFTHFFCYLRLRFIILQTFSFIKPFLSNNCFILKLAIRSVLLFFKAITFK
jgi:hypothetical protein